jgi:hypothetical protein
MLRSDPAPPAVAAAPAPPIPPLIVYVAAAAPTAADDPAPPFPILIVNVPELVAAETRPADDEAWPAPVVKVIVPDAPAPPPLLAPAVAEVNARLPPPPDALFRSPADPTVAVSVIPPPGAAPLAAAFDPAAPPVKTILPPPVAERAAFHVAAAVLETADPASVYVKVDAPVFVIVLMPGRKFASPGVSITRVFVASPWGASVVTVTVDPARVMLPMIEVGAVPVKATEAEPAPPVIAIPPPRPLVVI